MTPRQQVKLLKLQAFQELQSVEKGYHNLTYRYADLYTYVAV
jgi:hypothetical protein